MAQRTVIELTDDLDGSEAVETIHFSLQGVEYEIDLSERNAEKLRKALARYIDAGRKVGGRRTARPGGGGGGSTRRSSSDTAAVREWARAQGIQVSERGRVPHSLRDRYAAKS